MRVKRTVHIFSEYERPNNNTHFWRKIIWKLHGKIWKFLDCQKFKFGQYQISKEAGQGKFIYASVNVLVIYEYNHSEKLLHTLVRLNMFKFYDYAIPYFVICSRVTLRALGNMHKNVRSTITWICNIPKTTQMLNQ